MASCCSQRPASSASQTVGAAAVEDSRKTQDVTVDDPKCSRGFTYAMYEANAWQLKFAKSG